MRSKRIIFIVIVLILLFFIIFGLNFYFLKRLNDQIALKNNKSTIKSHLKLNSGTKWPDEDIEIILRLRVKALKPVYKNRNPRFYTIRSSIWENFIPRPYDNVENVWAASQKVS